MQRLWIQNAFLAGPHLNACGCETCAGEKVLVFCQWEDLKKHIAETLETMRVPHLQLSGNIYKRSDILRRFQDRITCPHLSIASYSSKMQRERFRDDIDWYCSILQQQTFSLKVQTYIFADHDADLQSKLTSDLHPISRPSKDQTFIVLSSLFRSPSFFFLLLLLLLHVVRVTICLFP